MSDIRKFLDECGAALAAASQPRPVRCLPPRELHLELTYACNARCVMCNLRHLETPGGDLTPAEIEKLVTESALLNDITFIVLSGGEALLRPDLVEVVRILRKRYPAVEILILSNLFDTRRVIGGLTDIEQAVGLDKISLGSSIDGVGPVHDRVRGLDGSFASLEKSLEALRAAWPALYVSLNFTLTPENYDQMLPVYRWCGERRYPVSFQVLVQKAETRQFQWDEKLHRPEVNRQIDVLIRELIAGHGMEVRTGYELVSNPGLLSQLLNLHYMDKYIGDARRYFMNCPCGEQFAMIAPSGDLYFCPVLKKAIPGNIRTVPLDELWPSPAAESIRRSFEKRACHCWLTCSNSRMLEDALNQGLKPFLRSRLSGGAAE